MHNTNSPTEVSDDSIEAEIRRKGKTARRITPADIDAAISSEHYFTAAQGVAGAESAGAEPRDLEGIPALGLLTICVLVLRNGFIVTGESACASPENFDAEIGRKVARSNAKQKMWPLLGYMLKEVMAWE